jgi:hypothetical protein
MHLDLFQLNPISFYFDLVVDFGPGGESAPADPDTQDPLLGTIAFP